MSRRGIESAPLTFSTYTIDIRRFRKFTKGRGEFPAPPPHYQLLAPSHARILRSRQPASDRRAGAADNAIIATQIRARTCCLAWRGTWARHGKLTPSIVPGNTTGVLCVSDPELLLLLLYHIGGKSILRDGYREEMTWRTDRHVMVQVR